VALESSCSDAKDNDKGKFNFEKFSLKNINLNTRPIKEQYCLFLIIKFCVTKICDAFLVDGLVDCEDPECCTHNICRSNQLCVSAPKPIDILLRKQPPAITASFFERMKFLIEEGSLQNYAKQESFNER